MTTIALTWERPPLTKNDTRRQGHHHAMRRKWADALEEARWAIRAAKVEPITRRAVVILHWQQPNWIHRDGDGVGPTLSVCLDALVAERVLVDDWFKYVVHSGVTSHDPVKGVPGAFWLVVDEVGEC